MSDEESFGELFASRITRLKAAAKLSDGEVAKRALLDPDQLERILSGNEPIGMDTVILLAGAIGVPAEALLEGIEWISDGHGGGEYRITDPGD
jgi:transcriptional regulator with XRE-family HTH domain